MFAKTLSALLVVTVAAACCLAQEKDDQKPAELALLSDWVGVWDAAIEVWPRGLDAPSIKFKGVETIRAFGEHWVASDFESEFQGQTTSVHSIVGYDLDRRQLVGTIIDAGPYAATMAGTFDEATKSVRWQIRAKQPDGAPLFQKTTATQTSETERVLVLDMPTGNNDEFAKYMEIKFVRRPE